MKTIKLIVLMAIVAILFTNCDSSKHIVNNSQQSSIGQPILIPCNVQDDNDYFRDRGIISATNIQNARIAALDNAKKMIIRKLKSNVKAISNTYFRDSTGNSAINDVKQEMEEAMNIAVNQILNEARTICEEIYQADDGHYTAIIAIEISKPLVIERMAEKMAIRPNIDIEQSRKIVEEKISNK